MPTQTETGGCGSLWASIGAQAAVALCRSRCGEGEVERGRGANPIDWGHNNQSKYVKLFMPR